MPIDRLENPGMSQDPKPSREVRKRPQKCIFCAKTFCRSDVLYRHYRTCSCRGAAPIPQPLKKGKRKRACDACTRSKLRCDSDPPCETCLRNGIPCTWSKVEPEPSKIDLSSKNFPSVSENATIGDLYRRSMVGDINQAVLVAVTRIPRDFMITATTKERNHNSNTNGPSITSFLSNYIDPKVRSVPDTFGYTSAPLPEDSSSLDDASTDEGEKLRLSLAYHPVMLRSTPFDIDEITNLLQPATSDDQQLLDYFFSDQDASGNLLLQSPYLEDDQSWFGNTLTAGWNINNRLTDDLMYHLHEFCDTLPAGHLQCNPNHNLTSGLVLISPSNITKFVNIYFHHWNRHSPILHRGTFDPEKVSLPLLFVIILTGALFSSQDEATKAKALLNLAEEFAFRSKPFEKLLAGSSPVGYDEECISRDALQAAFSVAQLQLRASSATTRRDTRLVRFGQIVTASRTAGLMSARNTFFSSTKEQAGRPDQFEWDRFGHFEAMIRLVCGLFALDTSFMVFYNMSPRISVDELNIDMPCSLESYFATDAETCRSTASAELDSHLPQLNSVLASYLGDETQSQANLDKNHVCVLGFYVTIIALLRRIWILPLHEAFLPQRPTRRALSNWKHDWDLFVTEMTPQQSELSGFTKQAAIEFWHLSDIILTRTP